MLTIKYQGQFKKDYKLAVKRGCDIGEFEKVITLLVKTRFFRKSTVIMN